MRHIEKKSLAKNVDLEKSWGGIVVLVLGNVGGFAVKENEIADFCAFRLPGYKKTSGLSLKSRYFGRITFGKDHRGEKSD